MILLTNVDLASELMFFLEHQAVKKNIKYDARYHE